MAFCGDFGKVNECIMQRVRGRAIVSFAKVESADGLASKHANGVVVGGCSLHVKRKVPKTSRVGRLLVDDALALLKEMEGQTKGPLSSATSAKGTGADAGAGAPPSSAAGDCTAKENMGNKASTGKALATLQSKDQGAVGRGGGKASGAVKTSPVDRGSSATPGHGDISKAPKRRSPATVAQASGKTSGRSMVSMGECLGTEMGQKLLAMGWSEARVKAYMNRENNPNAYYYRFNDPGEQQRKGKFNAEEKAKFKELISKGVDYRWGLFSMQFPGRVGYQCSNFYRQLLASGEIVDANYVVDESTGKLTFKRTGKRTGRSSVKVGADRPDPPPRRPAAKPKAKAKTRSRSRTTAKSTKRQRAAAAKAKAKKPRFVGPETLPGFRDPMTGDKVDDLAISPYGHIMSYQSWMRVLQPCFDEESESFTKKKTNTCPFTSQRLTRRQLIKLDRSNIDDYRDKILNLPGSLATPALP